MSIASKFMGIASMGVERLPLLLANLTLGGISRNFLLFPSTPAFPNGFLTFSQLPMVFPLFPTFSRRISYIFPIVFSLFPTLPRAGDTGRAMLDSLGSNDV